MKKLNLRRLLARRDEAHILKDMLELVSTPVAVFAENGELLAGADISDGQCIPLEFESEIFGWVRGNVADAERIALLINHVIRREIEKVSLAQEGLDKYREINLLYNIGEQIFSCLEPVEIASLIITELTRFIVSDNISVMLYCDESKTLNIIAAAGREYFPKTVLRIGEGISGSVMLSGKAEIVNNVASDSRYVLGANIIGSCMCVPLKTKESCLGVINISRKDVRDFSAHDLGLAVALASQSAIAIENARLYENLREHNRTLEQTVAERTKELNASLIKVNAANRLIRKTFGRYLSEDVVDDILSSPDGTALGGESRLITIMMTDIRGFTSMSEKLHAKDVLNIINIYLEKMTEIIMKYNGTIIEFIGDAILAIFGAPVFREDDAIRAVACAIEMQNVMADVNTRCRELGYPEIEQGIGLNTGESVVGNIGSDKRTKYGVVGTNVNITSRIESYTVGGQILVSENTAKACGPILRTIKSLEIMPKGVNKPLTLFDVEGIDGNFNIYLPSMETAQLIELHKELPVGFIAFEEKHATMKQYEGRVIQLSRREAVIHSKTPAAPLSNLKLTMIDCNDEEITSCFYAKVIESPYCSPSAFKVCFTSIPLNGIDFLNSILAGNMTVETLYSRKSNRTPLRIHKGQ